MEHVKLIVLKFLATFVLLYLVLGIGYGMAVSSIFLINFVSIASYYIGDLIILRRTNNVIAALADFGIAFAAIYLLADMLTVGGDPLTAAFLSALVIGIYELFFHPYVAEVLDYDEEPLRVENYDYSTEASDEFDYLEDFGDDDDKL
ncbi:YndM family protein [Amphibacillus sediminis]|uniref:YndM family protein n=1 Tax=Amphibacillus sediminis TaxID=360185 RepID=UPI00082DC689|nr:YndM family protein [Amphibacillus sediminis]